MPLFPLFLADDDLSQREKRAQQHKANKPAVEISASVKKNLVIGGIVLLAIGIIVAGMAANQASASKCPGHWHGTFTVFEDGERVPFYPNQPNSPHGIAYNPSMPINNWEDADDGDATGTHLHGDDGVYHFHPAVSRCTSWDTAFEHLDASFDADGFTLDATHGPRAGTYDVNETHDLRFFTREAHGEWTEAKNLKFMDKQPANGAGLAIIYGNHTQEEIDALLAEAKIIDGTNYDPAR